MPILELIKNFFLGRRVEKEETFITPLPPDFKTAEEIGRFINKRREQENAMLKAKVLKLQSQLEDKEQEKRRIKEEQEIKENITRHIEEQKSLEKNKSLKLKIIGTNQPPTFFLKSNIPYLKFIGAYLQETREGDLLWYPLLKRGKAEVIFKKPAPSFEQFFKEEIGIVSQMRGGKIDSNFDISESGKPLFLRPKYSSKGKEVEVIQLADTEKREYENKIEELTIHISQLIQEIKNLKKREVEYTAQIGEQEIETETALAERDTWASRLALMAKKSSMTNKEVADLLSTVQDIKTEQVLTQRLSEQKTRKIKELQQELEETAPLRQKEKLKELAEQEISMQLSELKPDIKEAVKEVTSRKKKKQQPKEEEE